MLADDIHTHPMRAPANRPNAGRARTSYITKRAYIYENSRTRVEKGLAIIAAARALVTFDFAKLRQQLPVLPCCCSLPSPASARGTKGKIDAAGAERRRQLVKTQAAAAATRRVRERQLTLRSKLPLYLLLLLLLQLRARGKSRGIVKRKSCMQGEGKRERRRDFVKEPYYGRLLACACACICTSEPRFFISRAAVAAVAAIATSLKSCMKNRCE